MIQTIAIIGVGLIGGSVGLALRKAGFRGPILGVDDQRYIDPAVERRAIDRGVALGEACASADLIVLSQTISGILETISQLDPLVRPDALVTDVGSTKKIIADRARQSLARCAFLGGHPMAGKEVRGVSAADANLFQGRPWILTDDLDHPVSREFRHWITLFGAHEILLPPETHDKLVAWGSHLPQLVSTALAATLLDREPNATVIAGKGLLDMTRLAKSDYDDLWKGILLTNAPAIAVALDAYIAKLQELKENFETQFEKGNRFTQSKNYKRAEEATRKE